MLITHHHLVNQLLCLPFNIQSSQEIDARLDTNLIQEIHMPETESSAILAERHHVQSIHEVEENTVDLIEDSSLVCEATPPANGNAIRRCVNVPGESTVRAGPITSLSFTERRQLTHIHSLKQILVQDASLTSMAFDEQDYEQAAVLYDNLNSTACFYTTALRVLSKADWSPYVAFEDHIVHQAMQAIAQGWTTAINLRNYKFGLFHLALAMCTLPNNYMEKFNAPLTS